MSTATSAARRRSAAGLVLALVVAVVAGLTTVAVADVSDTISVVKEGESLSNVEIVARLAEATFSGATRRVVIGRDDVFADNMSSAVIQGDAPLLLVPPNGPIPQRVTDLLDSYAPQEVVLLGGDQAITPAVEQELAASYAVVRRFGQTRFETAVDIAEKEAPAAETAILARGIGSPDATDPTQAFADALAAGGWAADNRWPILLTPTAELPASVEAYLTRSSIRNVMIMGGTAAVSEAVEDRLQDMDIAVTRVGGATRFATAIAVAEMRGVTSAADAERVVLVEGQDPNAWAAGFAAAAHSAMFDAPIVLANGDGIPGPTGAFLSGSTFAQAGFFDNAVLTCATQPAACERARELRGLPAEVAVTIIPADGAQQEAGTEVQASISGGDGAAATLSGDCIPTVSGSSPVTLTATISATATGPCTLTTTVSLQGGSVQTDSATFEVLPSTAQVESASGILTGVTGSNTYTWVPGLQEAQVTILPAHQLTVDGAPATLAEFTTAANAGDLVTVTTRTQRQSSTVTHALTNRSPSVYTDGPVGDVDLSAQQAWIVEPVSGQRLRSFGFGSAALQLNNAATDLPTFRGSISEGDRVVLTVSGDTVTGVSLTEGTLQGPVVDRAEEVSGLRFRVGTGGLPASPNGGDEPSSNQDLTFLVANPSAGQPPAQALRVDGAGVTYGQFRDLLANGGQLRYARTGGTEIFELTGLATSSTVSGLATETHDVAGSGALTLLVSGQGRVQQGLASNAQVFIGGVEVTRAQFNAAYTGGDMLQITTPTASARQQVRLTQSPASGSVSGASVQARTYNITNADGTVFQQMSWVGDPFRISITSHIFFINNQQVSQTQFESELARASGTQSVQVVPGNDPTALGPANEHRLSVGGIN